MTPITEQVAKKVLATIDAGLSSGLGQPRPGEMCIEAAVCYALGQPHGDEPVCVAPAVRAFKIILNDANWSSNAARAKGMRRLGLVQLGTAGTLDEVAFAKAIVEMTIQVVVPIALRAAALVHPDLKHQVALNRAADDCELKGTKDAASDAARAASDAALAKIAEAAVQVLVGLGAAGAQRLGLTE